MNRLKSLNRYLYYRCRKTRIVVFPERLYLELTNHCNFRCIMCPNGMGLMRRPRGFMEMNLFTAIIEEMAPHVSTIVLHTWGESLLHPRFFEMIAYVSKFTVKTELSTNTSLLDEGMSQKLLQSGLSRIYLCLDGATKPTYEKIRKNGSFEKAVEATERFIRLKNTSALGGPQIYLQIIRMAETEKEILAFRRRWELSGVDKVHIKPLDTWGGQVEAVGRLSDAGDRPSHRLPCPNLWYHAHVYHDGTMVCCDRDFNAVYPIGNVGQGVMRIWNGPEMQLLRSKQIRIELEDVPPCRNCIEWSWWTPKPFSGHGNLPRK